MKKIIILVVAMSVCAQAFAEKEKIYCVDRAWGCDDCYLTLDEAKDAWDGKRFWRGEPRNIYERDMAIKET